MYSTFLQVRIFGEIDAAKSYGLLLKLAIGERQVNSELVAELKVHLMLCQPKRENCDLMSKVVDLNADEVGEIDCR